MKFLVILFLSYHLNAQDLVVEPTYLDGTIHFEFVKSEEDENYFFIGDHFCSSKGVEYDLNQNYSRAERILELCGDENNLISLALKQREESFLINDSKYFKSKMKYQSGIHFGGQIFNSLSQEDLIKIVIKVKGIGLLIKSSCPAINHPLLIESQHCDFQNKFKYPILLFTNIQSIDKITSDEISQLLLTPFDHEQFKVIYCE